MREEKQALRARAFLLRKSHSRAELEAWNRQIQEKVTSLPAYQCCFSLALYSPVGNEVATEAIRDHALEHGKRVFYPCMREGDRYEMIRIGSPSDLGKGRYGILEPLGKERMTEEDREALLVLVPGLAFDLGGNRLGRGKGWYDRVINRLGNSARLVGLAYEFQIADSLPTEENDQRVHQIITERRVINCDAPE